MTAKQKAAREKFKKVVAEAAKLRKKNPKLTQAQAVKQAFAISYSKAGKTKVGAVKKKAAPKKKAAAKKVTGSHKDTKSHNVNIKVVSGTKKKVGDYWNRDVLYKDAKGPKSTGKGDYKTSRNKNGKFEYFTKISGKIPSEYVSLSGYNFGKEIVVGSVSKLSTLKNLVPDVKLRVTRGKRAVSESVTSPEVGAEIFKRFIGKNKIETQELFAVAYTNQANKILGVYVHSVGSINAVNVDVRLVLAGALQMGATGMILCHNHPSGNLKPSSADETITKQLQKAAQLHNISILDHIIITKDGYFSFVQAGLI